MPVIHTIRAKNESTNDVISLVLSQDAVSPGPNGDPWCGVTLSADQARSLAQRLSSIALEIENREEPGSRTSSRSLIHLSSIAVVHDGSLQGHRALQAGLQFASRSFSRLNLLGIFGLKAKTGEAPGLTEDYEAQRGWLSRLAEMYEDEASAAGVRFRSKLFPAIEPCALLDALYHMDSDLIVIPKNLTRFGNHGERLMPSIVSRLHSNVLICP